jgi:hypothetical protein
MAAKENLRPLKTLVFSMGALLLGGTVLLIGVAWQKAATHGKARVCEGGKIDLKGLGSVIDYKMDDQILRITLERQDKAGHTFNDIVTVDSCSGKTLSTLTIETDPALNPE